MINITSLIPSFRFLITLFKGVGHLFNQFPYIIFNLKNIIFKKTNPILIKFFEWLYFRDKYYEAGAYCHQRIVKIIRFNKFYVAVYAGSYDIPLHYQAVTCYWNWSRIKNIIFKNLAH